MSNLPRGAQNLSRLHRGVVGNKNLDLAPTASASWRSCPAKTNSRITTSPSSKSSSTNSGAACLSANSFNADKRFKARCGIWAHRRLPSSNAGVRNSPRWSADERTWIWSFPESLAFIHPVLQPRHRQLHAFLGACADAECEKSECCRRFRGKRQRNGHTPSGEGRDEYCHTPGPT